MTTQKGSLKAVPHLPIQQVPQRVILHTQRTVFPKKVQEATHTAVPWNMTLARITWKKIQRKPFHKL